MKLARSLDLFLAAILTWGIMLLLADGDVSRPETPVAFIFVLFLPGYTFSNVIFPKVTAFERFIMSLGFSIAISVAIGISLNWTPITYTSTTWLLTLGISTTLAAGVALLRRQTVSNVPRLAPGFSINLTHVYYLVGFGAAAIIAFFSYARLCENDLQYRTAGFTQLAMLENKQGDGALTSLHIDVRNREKSPMRYNLQLLQGTQVYEQWIDIQLAPGENWETEITVPRPTNEVLPMRWELRLYREDRPGEVYRELHLRLY